MTSSILRGVLMSALVLTASPLFAAIPAGLNDRCAIPLTRMPVDRNAFPSRAVPAPSSIDPIPNVVPSPSCDTPQLALSQSPARYEISAVPKGFMARQRPGGFSIRLPFGNTLRPQVEFDPSPLPRTLPGQ